MKLNMYITAPEPISTAYSIIPPISLYVRMCIPPFVTTAKSTIEELCQWRFLAVPLSLLAMNSVETFQQQVELFEASFPMRFMLLQRKVDD
jgi:hypothetical protein